MHVDRCERCQLSSTVDHRQFASVHFCAQHDERDAAGSSATHVLDNTEYSTTKNDLGGHSEQQIHYEAYSCLRQTFDKSNWLRPVLELVQTGAFTLYVRLCNKRWCGRIKHATLIIPYLRQQRATPLTEAISQQIYGLNCFCSYCFFYTCLLVHCAIM